MLLKSKLARFRHRLHEDGLQALPGWAWRWLYWNGGLHQLYLLLTKLTGSRRETVVARELPPISESIRIYSETHSDITCQVIARSKTIIRTLPQTVEPYVHELFTRAQRKEVPEKYLARISRAKIVGQHGLLVLPDGSCAWEWAFDNEVIQREPAYYRPWPVQAKWQSGHYYSLMSPHFPNYYHWIHDEALRLHDVIELLPVDVRFVVPANLSLNQRAVLAIVGISDEQLVFFGGDEIWELETLYFSSYTKRPSYDLPEEAHWFRERVFTNYGLKPVVGQRRLFINRRSATHWRITNQDEVESCVRDYGFESCLPENMSFQEQVVLFAQAGMVVANHGAGLTNMLFAPPGTSVLEIIEPTLLRNVYWSMCDAVGHQHWYFFGQSVPNLQNKDSNVPDLFVPLDKLKASLDRMVAVAEASA